MKGQRLILLGLIVALAAILTPLGLHVLRLGGGLSMAWVFATWIFLVVLGVFVSRLNARSLSDGKPNETDADLPAANDRDPRP